MEYLWICWIAIITKIIFTLKSAYFERCVYMQTPKQRKNLQFRQPQRIFDKCIICISSGTAVHGSHAHFYMNDISFFGDITLETITICMMTAKRSLCNRINTLKSYIERLLVGKFGRSYYIWCKFCWIRQWSTQRSPLLFSPDLGECYQTTFKNVSHWSSIFVKCVTVLISWLEPSQSSLVLCCRFRNRSNSRH